MEPLVVTGGSGQLGRRIAKRLEARGIGQRLLTRDLTHAFEVHGAEWLQGNYGDAVRMRQVFDGATTVLLVSATETADRAERHATAVDAAVAAGVKRIIYLSFVGAAPDATFTFARDHWVTEQRIREHGVAFTFLRDSLYQDVLPEWVGPDGVLRGPAGDGRVGAVTRDDIADVAAEVVTARGEHDGRTYDVTGPEAITFHDAAEALSRATEATITYHPEPVEEAYRSRSALGAEDWEVTGWVTSYLAVAAGELDVVTDTVEAVAGHPATSFAEYLDLNPEVVDRLRARLA